MARLYVTHYNGWDDTYTLSDGNRITRYELMMNPQFLSHPYLGSGAINGRYRHTNTTTHSSSTVGANQGHTGAQALASQQAAYNNALAQQAAYAQQAITYASTNGIGWVNVTTIGSGGAGGAGTYFPGGQTRRPIEYAGVIAGEIIAWRIWFVRDRRLISTYTSSVWEPGVPMTGDPMGGCGFHGVHAWKDKDEALRYAFGFGRWPMAVGQVKLWGEVVEHDRGYRAENAKIIHIESVRYDEFDVIGKKEIQRLRKLYGVDDNAIGDNNGKGKAPSESGQETLDDSGRAGPPLGRYARIRNALFGRRHLRDSL